MMNHVNFNDIIDGLKRRTKAGELPREVRIAEIDRVTEEWFAKTGDMPDAKQIERLADLILHEELTDTHPDKMTTAEYPFMSEEQYARRTEGRHVKKKNNRKEVGFSASHTVGTDGRNHAKPLRRVREDNENKYIDKVTKTRNKERRQTYNDFTKVQPVITTNLNSTV
jgi:hypothetical protein